MLLLIERRDTMVEDINIFEKKIAVCLDREGYNNKPDKKEVREISERIAGQASFLTIQELMDSATLQIGRASCRERV